MFQGEVLWNNEFNGVGALQDENVKIIGSLGPGKKQGDTEGPSLAEFDVWRLHGSYG